MKTCLLIALFLFQSTFAVAGLERIKIIKNNEKLSRILVNLIMAGELEESSNLGESICKVGDGSYCGGVGLGEGICRAGGGFNCSGVGIGEGICRAAGKYRCNGL